MNTKALLTSSSILLAIIGILLTFIPDELITNLGIIPNPVVTIVFQLLGALYLGFAMVNWMAKGALIGGIYNKPVAVGNFMHFAVGAFALIKVVFTLNTHNVFVISLTVIYIIFAFLFGYVFRMNPLKEK